MSETLSNDNNQKQNTYRGAFRSTMLFGGVQLWKILIEIIKQKVIAVLLGTNGMGIGGLYTSATQLIQGLTSMGLSLSAVKNVAEASATNDDLRVSQVVTVLRRLVWITGLLGVIVVIILSPWLSKVTFGNYDYTLPFILLSSTLLFNQLSAGQSVILQGLRKLKYIAKSSVYGSLCSLLLSIPIYYFLGIKGIVPTLIITSISTLFFTWLFSKRITIRKVDINIKDTFQQGKDMLKMGLAISFTSILSYLVAYLVRIFIAKIGGTEEVGLFVAGFAIMNGYVGLVFSAMGTDYYPRLSKVNQNNTLCKQVINQQAEIAVLLLSPILMFFLLLAPIAVNILYSQDFLPIVGFMRLMSLGILFKAASWSISFIFIAKQDMKSYIINEALSNVLTIITCLVGYKLIGLNGIGLAFIVNYIVYSIVVYCVAFKKYNFKFDSSFNKVFIIQLLLLCCCFSLLFFFKIHLYYIVIPLIIISTIYSLIQLNNRMNLIQLLKNRYKIK